MILKSVADKKTVRDLLLEDSEDAQIIQSIEPRLKSKEKAVHKEAEHIENVQPFYLDKDSQASPHIMLETNSDPVAPFIVANTVAVPLMHLQKDCIIPVFSKDNEKTIAHQEFIEVIMDAVTKVFPQHSIADPEIRVSHQIKGRTPTAIHKSANDLLEEDKTIYYERMAFMVKIPSITDEINGNKLSLCVGGVRSYNQENLYSKKSLEKFKFFIGFQNWVCMNMCISTDGFLENLRVSNTHELESKALEVMQNYNAELHLMEMKELTQDYLSEHQFAQLIGKSRLYQHLPKSERQRIPELNFNDSHINTMAKDYYEDQNFCRMEDGRINLWNVFNLFTQANKSSYIDTFLDRNLNAFEFSKGLQNTLNGDSNYHWFLS
nr:DUF3871 family protein [Marnyiella aurantia]